MYDLEMIKEVGFCKGIENYSRHFSPRQAGDPAPCLIDYLPKGVYVFEYPVRVQLKGKYPTGFANIECMYAPEFNSHSESIPLIVQ